MFNPWTTCWHRMEILRGKSQKKSKTSSSFSMENCQVQCCGAIGASKDSNRNTEVRDMGKVLPRALADVGALRELWLPRNSSCDPFGHPVAVGLENQDYLSRILLHTFHGYLWWIPLVHFGGIPTSMCFMTVNHWHCAEAMFGAQNLFETLVTCREFVSLGACLSVVVGSVTR